MFVHPLAEFMEKEMLVWERSAGGRQQTATGHLGTGGEREHCRNRPREFLKGGSPLFWQLSPCVSVSLPAVQGSVAGEVVAELVLQQDVAIVSGIS